MRTANWNPARNLDESFEEYKLRRKEMNEGIRRWLKGRLVWNSQRDGQAQGVMVGPHRKEYRKWGK